MAEATAKPKILVQLASDQHASVFDAVVAIDSGVDHLIQQASVDAADVRDLVHGAIFTRGVKDLKSTAIFVGGRNVSTGEQLMKEVVSSFFGPMRVSVMMDASGANTTAAAAVLAASQHIDLSQSTVTVLAATGPVGQRAALLAAMEGASVRVASRRQERAQHVCDDILAKLPEANLSAVGVANEATTIASLDGTDVLIAAGAASVQLVSQQARDSVSELKVIVDLNAVPPLGVAGVDAMAKAEAQDGAICYGAIGVGGLKMKIHKRAVASLFDSNETVLDAVEIFQLGKSVV